MRIGCLDIFNGVDAGKRILLKNLSVFEAGRSTGNHVRFKDASVAMSHFRLCREGEDYCIYDLGTKKGTLVNGARVEKAKLQAGDIIQAGELQIAFQLVADDTQGRLASAAPDSSEKDSQAFHGGVLTKTRASAPTLIVVDGRESGKRLPLSGKARYRIGRDETADFRLTDEKVSAEHCLVQESPEGHVIVDLESEAGTVVNGDKVERALLHEGDFVRLGLTMLRYERM